MWIFIPFGLIGFVVLRVLQLQFIALIKYSDAVLKIVPQLQDRCSGNNLSNQLNTKEIVDSKRVPHRSQNSTLATPEAHFLYGLKPWSC